MTHFNRVLAVAAFLWVIGMLTVLIHWLGGWLAVFLLALATSLSWWRWDTRQKGAL